MPDREDVAKGLIAIGTWGLEGVQLGERANYRCEYCELDFLASAGNYKQWHVDHIVPTSRGGDDSFDNKALACSVCNYHWKRAWDPRTTAGEGAGRSTLIEAARKYIAERRARTEEEVKKVRAIVGRTEGSALTV